MQETLPANDRRHPDGRYALSIRILHWLIALFILCLLAVGLIMEGLPHDNPYRGWLFSLHKSFGLTVLALAFIRLMLRLKLGVPPLPKIISAIERFLAQSGHYLLYFFMFAMPVSGYLLTTSYGLPVKWFGIPLPKLVGIDKDRGHLAAEFHAYAAYTLIALIAIHVSAVLVHYLRQRINLLKRML